MKILKRLLTIIFGLAAALAVIGLALPREVHIERSAVLAAKPATVFTFLNGFKNFNKWSPWADLDPATTYSFEGALMGVGAKSSWASEQHKVGKGSQQITAVEPNESISIELKLPDMSPSAVQYLLTPEGEGTKLVWSMDADMGMNPFNRWIGLLLEKLIGPDYEKGLAKMQPLIAALPKDDLASNGTMLVPTVAMPLLVVSDTGSGAGDGADAAAKLSAAYQKISAWMKANGYQAAGAPLAITREFNEQTKVWAFDAAIRVNKPGAAPAADSGVKAIDSYAGTALKLTHLGPYSSLEPSYARLKAYQRVAGLEDNGNAWELYLNSPADTPADQLKTDIYWPVK